MIANPGLVDGFGRRIEYLRISVTDRCNFRCRYCMPMAGLPWIPRDELLTDAEIVEVARQLAALGLRRVRLTGGEPTLRPTLVDLVAALRAVDGIAELSLSTNGVRLAELAPALRRAGLDRVNMSADSLRADRIREIARRRVCFDPIAAAEAAVAAGLTPVKLNVVPIRGVNDDEIEDFARLTMDRPWHVRFIELMPVGELADLASSHIVPSSEVLERIARLGAVTPVAGPAGNGPARYHRLAGALGTVGVITPMTHTFCDACNRVRLTARGSLRTCLFGTHEVDLRVPLRAGEPLAPFVRAALAAKPRAHELLQLHTGGLRALSQVGG